MYYYKSVHHSIPTLPVGTGNREHPGNFQNKSVNSPFNWNSRYILFLHKLRGKERSFLERCKKGDHIARLSPRAFGWYKRWKTSSFCEIWNNHIHPLFFIRLPYKWALQDMEFYDKLTDRFQEVKMKKLPKVKNPAVSNAKIA